MATSWIRLADITITGSASNNLDTGVGGIVAKNHLRVMIHVIADGSDDITEKIRFNGDTSGNYAYVQSTDGAGESGDTGEDSLRLYGTSNEDRFYVLDIMNIANKEKCIQGNLIINTNGSSNAPKGMEFAAKWVNTLAQITDIQVTCVPSASGNYAVGSQMTIFGADDEATTDKSKTSITDVEVGTRYEETDTRKIFRRTSSAWVERGTAE